MRLITACCKQCVGPRIVQYIYIYIYIKRSSYVKRSDSIKVRLCSRCYRYHRLIDCKNVVNNVLVQGQCSRLSTASPMSWL